MTQRQVTTRYLTEGDQANVWEVALSVMLRYFAGFLVSRFASRTVSSLIVWLLLSRR